MQNQKKKMVQKEARKKYSKKLTSQEEKKKWMGEKLRLQGSEKKESEEEETSNESIAKEMIQKGAETASFVVSKGSNRLTYSKKQHGRNQRKPEEGVDKNKQMQKVKIKKAYAKQKRHDRRFLPNIPQTKAEKMEEAVVKRIVDNPMPVFLFIIFGLAVMLIFSAASSCTVVSLGVEHVSIVTSYTAKDRHILQVDDEYKALEEELKEEIDSIEARYPGYDEYVYELAEIGHNPYHLAALLTVLFEDYQPQEVRQFLREILELQYEHTTEEIIEIRTRTEMESGYEMVEQEDGTFELEYYEREIEVEYEYRILKVTLENYSIDGVAEMIGLDAEEMQRYQLLWETKGNKPYLFANYDRPQEWEPEEEYRVPAEALTNEDFRRMISLAEQFLGYSYVWGGSTPETGFDCSGFVSYVINNCGNGWDVGRQNVRGLIAATTSVSRNEAAPGDLIFFKNTGGISGISHVGIYVGDGKMIHCGDPIRYVSIETNYWQEHLYGYGRMP